ncbi:MAG: PQQ-binding-like beta-propeller repeat protein, partial [candidate division Zixibacteria bacterium]|nr:PQQ-binding-like beta-propeller repeat protein [candidate division Zixibacteria bacterium]
RFHKFTNLESDPAGFPHYRLSASGNTVIEKSNAVPDTLLFKRKLNGGISAQVVGNRQFAIVSTLNKRIYFLQSSSGKEITSLVTKSAIGAAVALVDELVYFAEESGGDRLICFNLVSGKKVWKFAVDDPQGAPIVYDEDIFISSRPGILYRLNRWLGEEIWKYDLSGQSYTAAAVDSDHVYIGSALGELLCLNRQDAELLWSYRTGGAIVASPMVDKFLYCGSSDGAMYALNRVNGELIWKYETAGKIFTTPVATRGLLLFGSHDRNVYCLDAGNGDLLWSYETDGILRSSPIVVGDHFLCATAAGTVYIFDLAGKVIKTFTVNGSVSAPLSYFDSKLYVATRKRMIYCFGNSSTSSKH